VATNGISGCAAAAAAAAAATSAAAATAPLVVDVHPADCGGATAGADCHATIAAAVRRCRAHGPGCSVVLAPGHYRVRCPSYSGPYPYVYTPGAVDLSNTSGITFGGAAGAAASQRPRLDADYQGQGCPAVAATDATDVTVQHIVLDTARLPFTDAVVSSVSADKRTVEIKMKEPDKAEFDPQKYPWLVTFMSMNAKGFAGFSNSSWNATAGVATLSYPHPVASSIKPGQSTFWKHFDNMQAWGVYGLRVQGLYMFDHVTLQSCAGMAYRCDYCNGTFDMQHSELNPGPGRTMSSTADGVHFMHHRGLIKMRNSLVNGTGDDCFNVHGNFLVLAATQVPGHPADTVEYIDETGPGWFPAAPLGMIGDRVAFYSRLTLQQIGDENILLGATGGFGENATLKFRDPVPAGVFRYDMLISLDRVASLDIESSTFQRGGRGMVISAHGVRIRNNTFVDNGFGRGANAILFLEGGCGAYRLRVIIITIRTLD
jgi:hypothetical protein